MQNLIKIEDDLNELLEMEISDETKLDEICQTLRTDNLFPFVLADFEFYNAEKLEQIIDEKYKSVKAQNFDNAANLRILEKKCLKYVIFNKFFKLEKSLFYPEYDTLIYLYTGKSKNDTAVYSRLTAIGTGVFSKTKNRT